MSAKKLLLGLAVGLVLALVLLPSVVAALYGWHPSLGAALDPGGWFYNPLAMLQWVSWWGDRPGFQEKLLMASGASLVPLFLPVLFMAGPPRFKPGKHDDDDGFGTVRDLRKIAGIDTDPGRVVLGDAGKGRVLYLHGDKHCLYLGPSGSDKDVAGVIPSLLMDSGSVLAFDPKREYADIVSRRRREFGPVHVLDLGDPRPDTASFNPLSMIRKGFEVEDAALIATLLAFQHDDEDRGGKSATWNAAAAKMLTAGVLQVHGSKKRTLAELRGWAQKVIEQKYPDPAHEYVEAAILAHEALSGETRTSVNFNIDTATGFLTYGESIDRVTGESTFDPADLMCGADPMTVLLTVSPSHRKSLRPLQRLMLTMLVHPLKQKQFHAADGRKKVRAMTLCASEFTTMGKLDLFATDMKDLRGYGFRYVLSTQGIEDINAVYGENNPILLNCQAVVAIPGFGQKTNKFLADVCGKKWIVTSSASRKPGLFQLPTKSESERQVDVLDLAKAQERALTESLVLVRGCKPTWMKRARYFEHPAFRRLYDTQPGSELLRG